MSERFERAMALHADAYNCAQVVIGAIAQEQGFDLTTALGFAASFGGGLRMGEVCGAACGAVMAIGRVYGQIYPGDVAAKGQCGLVTGQFMQEFARRMGALRCVDLLGGDQRDPALADQIAARKKEVCPRCIQTALEILEEMGV